MERPAKVHQMQQFRQKNPISFFPYHLPLKTPKMPNKSHICPPIKYDLFNTTLNDSPVNVLLTNIHENQNDG